MPRANVLSEKKVKYDQKRCVGPGPPYRGGRERFPEHPCTVYKEGRIEFVRTGRAISL